jgi:hypothetical protein
MANKTQRVPTPPKGNGLMRLGIVGVVVFIAAYVGSIVLYVYSDIGVSQRIVKSPPSSAGTTVIGDAADVQSGNSLLIANVTVLPGPELLDPRTHDLKEDLSVVVTSATTPSKHTWPKGALPDVFRVSLPIIGDVADWPFDRYQSGPITVLLVSGAAQEPVPATLILVDRLLGWELDEARGSNADVQGPFRVVLYRSHSSVAFGVVILGVLIALAGVALFVAIQTARDRRKFQPPMTTWYAAMLFAVMPLRNALPDSPPFGSWIDVTIVLWVIVVLVISMVLYISCWWRHLKPDVDQ